MIEYKTGDIFTSQADVLVNPVNCMGVMGKGLAKEFKRLFLDEYREYKRACDAGAVRPGDVRYYSTGLMGPWFIACAFTKNHWRDPSQPEWVESCINTLFGTSEKKSLTVAMPKLGCGLGGLDWETVVRPMVDAANERYPGARVEVYV
jgi:O-acetyl-ADP-ribose deacetylase (regulator of RNase III)